MCAIKTMLKIFFKSYILPKTNLNISKWSWNFDEETFPYFTSKRNATVRNKTGLENPKYTVSKSEVESWKNCVSGQSRIECNFGLLTLGQPQCLPNFGQRPISKTFRFMTPYLNFTKKEILWKLWDHKNNNELH